MSHPVTFHRPWIFGDAGEPLVSIATRLLHHYSPAAVVKLVFGQALRQPNSDSTHSSHTHTAAHAKPSELFQLQDHDHMSKQIVIGGCYLGFLTD